MRTAVRRCALFTVAVIVSLSFLSKDVSAAIGGPSSRTIPLVFNSNTSFRRRGSNDLQQLRKAQLTSTYYEYEDGEDEWDRLDRIKKELENKLGGYRPWSIDTSYKRPGEYSWTSRLIIFNVIMYGLQMVNPNVTRMFAKRSDMIMSGKQLYRLFTPMFLHGSVSHLMLNSFSLSNIGPEVERLFGSGRFLATYVVGGIAGNLASAMYTPNPSLGASGAVFSLMGAYYTFLSRNEHLFGRSGQAMMGRVGSTLGMNIVFGMMSPAIDNFAHIGGGIGGVAIATAFGPKLFLMGLPAGGQIIVDKPAVRLPPSIEDIPRKISKRIKKAKRRMQVQRYQSELPAKPWRRNRNKNQWQQRKTGGTFNRKPMYGE